MAGRETESQILEIEAGDGTSELACLIGYSFSDLRWYPCGDAGVGRLLCGLIYFHRLAFLSECRVPQGPFFRPLFIAGPRLLSTSALVVPLLCDCYLQHLCFAKVIGQADFGPTERTNCRSALHMVGSLGEDDCRYAICACWHVVLRAARTW